MACLYRLRCRQLCMLLALTRSMYISKNECEYCLPIFAILTQAIGGSNRKKRHRNEQVCHSHAQLSHNGHTPETCRYGLYLSYLSSMASLRRSSVVTSVARRSLATGSSQTGAVVGARQISSEVHHDEHHSDSDHPTGPESTFSDDPVIPSPDDGTTWQHFLLPSGGMLSSAES